MSELWAVLVAPYVAHGVFDTREEAEERAETLLTPGFQYKKSQDAIVTVWQDHGPLELKVVVQMVPYGY